MRRPRNFTVYTGRVGRPMRPAPWRINRRVAKQPVRLIDGPMKGETLWLDRDANPCTLAVVIRGEAGRYVGNRWEPAR